MATDPHDHSHHHDDEHDHDHHHGDNHPHDPIEVTEGAGEYEIMVHAIKELLIEKGVITGEEIRKTLEFMDTRTPALGAKVVARAWADAEFKKRLLTNGTAAVAEMGIPMGDAELIAVENSKEVHNVIVCTLCSCYPRTVLGLPPDWYKSRNYRSRVVVEPRAVLKEFGTELPDSVTLRTHDSNADMRYLVLPERPPGTAGWSEEELAAIVTRDCMIGVAFPKVG
jgi:thiocyanate hydrolase subunit gamma